MLIEEMRSEIFRSKAGYRELASRCQLSQSTIGNLARGKTAWPRPKTMNALLKELGLRLTLTEAGE
jgi:transcriptional regulator with XRE-family HTH domain